ncbi:MAG: trehalose-6-phosphate synthase, partial [Nocardia sp.]|nr:trehalose-6-phosphate synthase [Nocardia sp.]
MIDQPSNDRPSEETLTPSGSGSGFVVVANRLPVDLERLPDGTTRWKRSPGGLVTALEPVLRSNKGAWVGWAGVP